MARLFSFRGEMAWGAMRAEIIFIYIPICEITPSDIELKLNAQLNDGGISPDIIVFITTHIQHKNVKDILCDNLLTERFKNIHRCKGIVLAPFNKHGQFENFQWIIKGNKDIPEPDKNHIIETARNAGFKSLVSNNGVITKAPPGAYFRNPSQNPRSYFIRAALLCRNSVEASFISFTLLPLVAKAESLYNKVPNIIWVDTISIAYIAYALSELCTHLKIFSSEPEIRSYSSYSELAKTSPESGDYPIFLISASTSGGMAKDLVEITDGRVKRESIGTILGSFEDQFPQLIYLIPEYLRGRKIESFDTLREIIVSGEDFLFSPGEPIPVSLKKSHLPKDFPNTFEKIQEKGLIHSFKRLNGNKMPKAFYIDGESLSKDKNFVSWIKKKAIGNLPGTVGRIIYQEDEGSIKMAKVVRKAIKSFKGNVPISSVSDIENLTANESETVVIVAAVVGSGMELMRITKALRKYQPEGSRYFLIGAVLARSCLQLEQFKSNLRKAGSNLTYTVEAWCEFATTTSALHQLNKREEELLDEIKDNTPNTKLTEYLEARLNSIKAKGIVHKGSLKSQPFISFSGVDGAFDLSKGFALWNKVTNKRCPNEVLFTVACMLQNARECSSLAHSDRLDGGGFQQAIIAPDCFLRFTDPVIQVSILRCAHDSELDYSSSLTASPRAAEIISKFMKLSEESIAEFLMALVLKRMRLRKDDKDRISSEAIEIFEHSNPFLYELAQRYQNLKE